MPKRKNWQLFLVLIILGLFFLSSAKIALAQIPSPINLLDYYLPTPDHQVELCVDANSDGTCDGERLTNLAIGNSLVISKWRDPARIETYIWDDQYIYLKYDASWPAEYYKCVDDVGDSYTLSNGKWLAKTMNVGEEIIVDPDINPGEKPNLVQAINRNTCEICEEPPGPYKVQLENQFPYNFGGDIGWQEAIVIKYTPNTTNLTNYEKFYIAKGWGPIKWESYLNNEKKYNLVKNRKTGLPPVYPTKRCRTCSVSLSSSQTTEGNSITVSYSGNPIISGKKVKLWLAGINGQTITGAKFNGSDLQPPSVYENKNYYPLAEATDQNLHTGSLTADTGNYFIFCDINYSPLPCSGNPFCDYESQTCSLTGSTACRSAECSSSGLFSCSQIDNQFLTVLPSTMPSLSLQIKFQGIGSQVTNKTVRVILKQAGVEKYRFDNLSVSANASGIFSGTISNLTPGTYDIYVKGWAHLQKKFASVNLTNGSNSQNWSASPLIVGDFDNNNLLNISDISSLLSNYTALSVPVNSNNQAYDTDANNIVDINDISLVLANYTALQVEGAKEN